MLLPKIVLERIPAQIDHQIVSDPKAGPFYKPFKRYPTAIAEADRSRLSQEAEKTIAAAVVPAFRHLKEFFLKEYSPAAWDQVGVWQLPQGEAMYGFFVRIDTTTNMTPEEIHEMGLSEVTRIRAEMQAIMDKVGYKGSSESFPQF